MDYDSLIKETKDALEGYSSVTAELEALYQKAKDNNNTSYELAKQELGKQYASDRNATVTKGKLDEKDMNQFLASRGLSSSGESVQAKIDSNISINNSLSELAKKNTSSLNLLEQEKLGTESELDTELADKKIELNQWQTELATQIAELKNSYEANKNAVAKSAIKADNSSNTKNSNNESVDSSDKTETTESYIPETSAKDLTKSILASYSTSGTVTTDLQKSYIKQYLNSLTKSENLDEDYLKELIINLKAVGYTDITDTSAEAEIAVDKSKSYYNGVYEQYYEIYLKGNRSEATAEKLAKTQAKTLMLDYIYERCSTTAAFERACRLVGVSYNELQEYYKRINNIIEKDSSSLALGSKLDN